MHLHKSALRLAAELDDAQLYRASAYALMVADSISHAIGGAAGTVGPGRDGGLQFELDEHGRVWMMRPDDCQIIGSGDAVGEAMRRFLPLSPDE
jgi:hypothetical protein